MAPSDDPKRDPGNAPPVRQPPDPATDDRGRTRRAPGHPEAPGSIEAPPAREPGPPPADPEGGAEDAHEGATEEQVGDRIGPGAGYDVPEKA